jgi:polar amino acid transport system substrate-binding protein
LKLTRFALPATVLLAAACSTGGGGATSAPTSAPPTSAATTAATSAPTAAATVAATTAPTSAPTSAPTNSGTAAPSPLSDVCKNLPSGAGSDLLAEICTRGKIIMSTDPAYPPQSELAPDDPLGYKGFDIDVGAEIAKRLGVDIGFETPNWDVLTAGSWNGRWDFSVGSMTITAEREKVLSFTKPYYYTPAQMAVRSDSDITTVDGLAGKVICVGAATTYLDWLEGKLDFGSATGEVTAGSPPAGSTGTTLPTDRDCAASWQSGRHDFDGWLSSITTVQGAIDDGLPVKAVGDPVFYEPLAVAFDNSAGAPAHDALLSVVDQIVADMHADGTLSELSMKWFGADYTTSIATAQP